MPSEVRLYEKAILEGLRKEVRGFANGLKKGSSVAIKMHMGERGSLFYLRPIYPRLVADELKKTGAKPFIFDSPTMYEGNRHDVDSYCETARMNGFTETTVGCPVIISNEGVEVETQLGKVHACKALMEADAMVVLSHFKGHPCASYGGAIKNLGMGGFTSESKSKIHHGTAARIAHIEKCIGCGTCVRVCPYHFLSVKDGKVAMEDCFGCGACAIACPNGVMEQPMPLGAGLAEVDSHLLKTFKKGAVLYVNVLMDIVERCDCAEHGYKDTNLVPTCPNVGIMASEDIVAIDQASLDMAQKLSGGRFGKLYGANPDVQTVAAEERGMGSRKYTLKKA